MPTDEPRLTVGFAMSERVAARGHRPGARWWRRWPTAVRGAMAERGHHRSGRRALRADQDAAADHRTPSGTRKSRGKTVCTEDTLRVDGRLQRVHRARHRGGAGRDRRCRRTRQIMARPIAVLVRGVVLVGGRARPGADRGGRQRPRRRRPLPDRPLGDDATRSTPTASGPPSADAGLDLPDRPRTDGPGRPAGQRVPQVRGVAGRPGPRPAQRHARRLRRPLAPADQGLRSAA